MVTKYKSIIAIHPTGSRFICDPPVMDTDDDYIVLGQHISQVVEELRADGWEADSERYRGSVTRGYTEDGPQFVSARKGNVNYIITDDEEYYDKYVVATLASKEYNLREKWQRIRMFHAVIDGEWLEESVCRQMVDTRVARRQIGSPRLTADELLDMAQRYFTVTSIPPSTGRVIRMSAPSPEEEEPSTSAFFRAVGPSVTASPSDAYVQEWAPSHTLPPPPAADVSVTDVVRAHQDERYAAAAAVARRYRSAMANQPGQTWRDEF